MATFQEFNSEFDRMITLASIIATYEFAGENYMHDLQEGVTDTFCKLFDIPDPAFFTEIGISIGEEGYH